MLWILLRKIEQCEGHTKKYCFLFATFQLPQKFIELFKFIQIKTVVLMPASLYQLFNHIHKRRISSFEVRRQKSQDAIVAGITEKIIETISEALFINS